MRAAQPLLTKSLLGRSLDELKRRTNIAMKFEAVKGPQGPRPLYDFTTSSSVTSCILMSDDLIGGQSLSSFDHIPSPSPHARFHGSISTALPPNKPAIKRSGYAAFRTPTQSPTVFGRSVWDIDPYSYLALRIKSDGRAYFINVQTEGVEPTDIHQHRLFAKRPGQWETVLVRWNDFVRTSYGFGMEPQTEILRQKVTTVGIGLTDRVEGPFELCIERMWATNTVEEGQTVIGKEEVEGEGLKNKKGERIQW